MSETESKPKLTVVLIEFELFEHDLIDTLNHICVLPSIDSVLIVSQQLLYPSIQSSVDSYGAKCRIHLIRTGPQVLRSLNDSRVESFINTEYVVIIPDSVRVESKNIVYHLINSLKSVEKQRIALLVPIVPKDESNKSVNKCIQIQFDVKRWTLVYIKGFSPDSCDAFEGDQYAVLIRRTHLLSLNQPFLRPFIDSFVIQSKIHNIRVKLLENLVIYKGRELYKSEKNKWKHNMWREERRKILYNMFGIKKMVDTNGKTHWFGCNKHSNRCFGSVVNDMPEYLFDNRWTPICCLKNLAQTGRHVFKTLEKFGVKYWLEGGSLLGAARDSQIIPWDYDIDIGIYRDDIRKCPLFNQQNPVIDEKGFVWEKASEGDFYRVQFSQTNRLHVDIFPFYSRNGTMTKDTWFDTHVQDREFPEHYLKPLTKVRFIDWDAFAPNNIIQFLEFKFGTNVISNPQYPKPHLLKFSNKSHIY